MVRPIPKAIVEKTFLTKVDPSIPGGWLYKMEAAEIPGTGGDSVVLLVYAHGPEHAKAIEAGTAVPDLFQVYADPASLIAFGEGLLARGQKALAARIQTAN